MTRQSKKPLIVIYRDIDKEYTMFFKQYIINFINEKRYSFKANLIFNYVKNTVNFKILLII